MKKLAIVLAAASLLFAACTKTKTIQLADFTATYPASLEVMHSSDNFPDDAALFFQGENGQIGMNTVVYYSDAELGHIAELYAEDGALHGFIYNKLMELFNKVDEGDILPGLDIEDVSQIEWSDDDLCGSFLFSGTHGEEADPFIGGITIYLNNGALVSSLAVGAQSDDVDELLGIATSLEFAPHEGSYHPTEIPE